MGRTVILSPHHDDVALFTAFNAIRHKAHIIVVLKSVKQEAEGVSDATRRREETQAAVELGCTADCWEHPDNQPDWDKVGADIAALEADLLFAPAPEPNGNVQHNMVGQLALQHHSNVTTYLTYTPDGKSEWGHRVPFEPGWVPMKLRALACHVSQASLPSCLEHFLRDQHEYVA